MHISHLHLSNKCQFETFLLNDQPCFSLWCCHILTDKGNGRRTDRKNAKKCLSGDGSRLEGGGNRRGSRKERICTEQVTERNGQLTYV